MADEKKKFNKVKYDNQFISENYDRINLTVKKGQKERIKEHAQIHDNGSVNSFINRAIDETIARDEEKTEN